jgi:hypothetical protein
MARVRTDNVFGTTTNNPLSNVGTTLNSAGLAGLAAVSGGDEAIITLDPNKVFGAPEIVVVSAHTALATSATIARGQFGTAARSHVSGTEWVHGPIASNATTPVTAADDQGDYVPLGAWTTFTPTLVQSGTVTKTVTYARFVRLGRTIFAQVDLSVTGSGTGANQVVIGLPVSAASGTLMVGTGLIYDSSATLVYNAIAEVMAGGAGVALRPTTSTTNANLGVTAFTAALASGDIVRYGVTYEAAT